jgi:hypothetical protein
MVPKLQKIEKSPNLYIAPSNYPSKKNTPPPFCPDDVTNQTESIDMLEENSSFSSSSTIKDDCVSIQFEEFCMRKHIEETIKYRSRHEQLRKLI